MANAHEVVAAYWAAAAARDWDAFGAVLAAGVVYEAPQTRERVRGRAAYLRFNAEGFPGDWQLTVQRIVAEGRSAASWIQIGVAPAKQPSGTTALAAHMLLPRTVQDVSPARTAPAIGGTALKRWPGGPGLTSIRSTPATRMTRRG